MPDAVPEGSASASTSATPVPAAGSPNKTAPNGDKATASDGKAGEGKDKDKEAVPAAPKPPHPLDGLSQAELRKKLEASKKDLRAYLDKKKKVDSDLVSPHVLSYTPCYGHCRPTASLNAAVLTGSRFASQASLEGSIYAFEGSYLSDALLPATTSATGAAQFGNIIKGCEFPCPAVALSHALLGIEACTDEYNAFPTSAQMTRTSKRPPLARIGSADAAPKNLGRAIACSV